MSRSEADELLFFLDRVREAVVRTIAGLSADQQRSAGVPSGTNLAGLIQHLTAMEIYWFQRVFLGRDVDTDATMVVASTTTADDLVATYRSAWSESNRIVRACDDLSAMTARAAGMPASTSRDAPPEPARQVSLRSVVVHMTQETARHAGHADILRELMDGETDL